MGRGESVMTAGMIAQAALAQGQPRLKWRVIFTTGSYSLEGDLNQFSVKGHVARCSSQFDGKSSRSRRQHA
jgi:hypothetical protein